LKWDLIIVIPGWPQIQPSCLCLQSARITDVHYYAAWPIVLNVLKTLGKKKKKPLGNMALLAILKLMLQVNKLMARLPFQPGIL
jgi:hypothetical protein